MEIKICGNCKKSFPKTEEYFFYKICKQKISTGEIRIYKSLRSICKTCNSIVTLNKLHIKKCKELNCTEEDRRKIVFKNMSYSETKYKELYDIPVDKRGHIIKAINKGYVFTSLVQYKIDMQENQRQKAIRSRKYNPDRALTSQELNNINHELCSDARMAMRIKIPVKECPSELLENMRNTIKLKRLAGLVFSTKKERNINNEYKNKWKNVI